jgi:hypothetical protein
MSIPQQTMDEDPPEAGPILLVATTALVIFNMWMGFTREMRTTNNISAAIGGAVAQLIFPVVVALLFSISSSFRNGRSKTKAVFWTSVVMLIVGFAGTKDDPEARLAAQVKLLNTGPRMVDAVTRFDQVTQGPGMHITVFETVITKNAAEIPKVAWQGFVPKLRQQMLAGPMGKLISSGVSVTYRYSGKDGVLIGDVSSDR